MPPSLKWVDYFTYNETTGDLFWKVDRPSWSKTNIGDKAGQAQERGYLNIWIGGELYLAHRIVWEMHNGEITEGMVIDHEDHDTSNNRIGNLRLTTQTSNTRNNSRSKRNKSGTTGVMWREKEGKWMASITVNRKRIYLGRFENIEFAIKARKGAEAIYGFHENHGRAEEAV